MQAPPLAPTLGAMVAWLQRNPAWADALLGAGAAIVLVAITAFGFRDQGVDPIAYPCCAVAGLAFAVRRRWPVVTFALVIAALTVFAATGQPGGPVYATMFLAALNLAVLRPMRVWLPWTAVAAVSLVGANWVANGFEAHLIPVALLLLATPKLAGDAVRARRLRVETLEARVGLAEQETLRRVADRI